MIDCKFSVLRINIVLNNKIKYRNENNKLLIDQEQLCKNIIWIEKVI